MKHLPLLLAACFAVTGCASLASKSNYPVAIKSTPDGVKFKVVDEEGEVVARGVTPDVVDLSASDEAFSGANYTVYYQKGTQKAVKTISPGLDPWAVGNLLSPFWVGFVVDFSTGAVYKLPKSAHASLEKRFTSVDGVAKGQFIMASVDDLTDEERAQMSLIR